MNFYDENNNKIDNEYWEKNEQDLVKKYIKSTDVVLELGARYGTVSCTINKILNNQHNQVSVEPDERVWDALENNKKINDCHFNIIKGFISNNKLNLVNKNECIGYGTSSVIDINSSIKSYTLNEIKEIYNLSFNVLVADCEGFLEDFFEENPNIYNEIRLIIFEADYPEKCDYIKIKDILRIKNFINLLDGHQNVWIKEKL